MRGALALLLAGLATPAFAQHGGQSEPPAPAQDASCAPEHAAMGHCTPPPPAQPTADPDAGPQMPAQPAADPHAGHDMPAEEQEPVADPHAGHQMPAQEQAPLPPQAPPPPEALGGPEHAADAVYGLDQMAASRQVLRREHGALPAYRIFIERAETRFRDGRDGYLLDGQAWFGGDTDKAWFKGEVDGEWGQRPDHAEIQALWSHAIDPWFDLQAGVRYDPQPGPDRAHLVLGVQGLAPYWWEVDGALFLSNKGEVTARAEAEYDLRITQKLILQPRAELDVSFQTIRELGIGAGLSQAAVGLRLRYQVSPLVAPYVGLEYERAFGKTANFRRADGEDRGGWNLLAGIRLWF